MSCFEFYGNLLFSCNCHIDRVPGSFHKDAVEKRKITSHFLNLFSKDTEF